MSTWEAPVTNFEVIEGEKENIVPLRSGRSATALSKSISDKTELTSGSRIPEKRLEFEKRLLQELEDLDDPLELFLEYITWINVAYPQGGQSKQSGMLETLERCLMYFRDFDTYKNDPRYLKMWMWYIELFAGSQNEKQSLYVYMTRKQIGSRLSLFYESLADFLKLQSDYSQARDVLQKGIENGARPLARLRKTVQNFDDLMDTLNIKVKNVAAGESVLDQSINHMILGKEKGRIQESSPASLPSQSSLKRMIFRDVKKEDQFETLRKDGWDSLDSKVHRNKENEHTIHPLEPGTNVGVLRQEEASKMSVSRLPIFKDSIGRSGPIYKILEISGRKAEKIDCNFDLIYPSKDQEFCIEELLAISRNIYHRKRPRKRHQETENNDQLLQQNPPKKSKQILREVTSIATTSPSSRESPTSSQKENAQEFRKVERTSILPLKDDPSEQNGAYKKSTPSSPTVTFFSKDAINEVYSMFNQNYTAPQEVIDNDDTTSKFAMFENFTQDFTRKTMDDLTEVKTTNESEQTEKTPRKNQDLDSDQRAPKESMTPSYKSKLQEYMTPIQERTEANFNIKLASGQNNEDAFEGKKNETSITNTAESSPFLTQPQNVDNHEGHGHSVISNPLGEETRMKQLMTIKPPLSSYATFYQYNQSLKMSALLRKIHTASKNANKNPIVDFKKTNDLYCIRSQLGEGGYATVYLAESSTGSLKALKVEKPASIWEFYILKQVQKRLAGQTILDSIINVDSLHCFEDESYLVLNYASQGTVLDLINLEKERNGGPLDELLVMYFAVELMKVMECIHDVGIIHGDLKPDNCMIRFEESSESLPDYDANGENGWNRKGVYLIDFGRSFDLTLVPTGTKFKANWKTDQQDCSEMREGRTWTYEADYYGLAGIIHAMLFGRFIETRTLPNQTYTLINSFKRYWRLDIWPPLFDMLLNSGRNKTLPITAKLREFRTKLESALEDDGHRLRAQVLSLQSDLLKLKK
ncbi:LANO_0E15478g1_1 [Lachancea nothofagi CBS 11611]|uniref:LANO_0E15478g1_1 n=1 Tax=Lachancea nothofagi CBS 11611 TaxID=1266666 RepID=A0A1G4K188_9SACH|nr:LANO_0E15478g1_1 [Lachancea nothofagi CBS 11611]